MSTYSMDDILGILKEISKKLDMVSRKLDRLLFKGVSEEQELLSDPLKKQIYDLCDGNRTVTDILQEVRKTRTITQSRISQILIELEEAGIIESKRGTGDNWRCKYYQQSEAIKRSN